MEATSHLEQRHGDQGKRARSGRHFWLLSVLDAFAKELLSNEDMTDCRSKVLNPVLVRAFYKVDHYDQRDILKRVKDNCQIEGRRITLKHWEGFYHNVDVIHPVNKERWLTIKPMDLIEPTFPALGPGELH